MDTNARAEEIFSAALTVPPDDLSRFLRERCGDDSRLILEVRSLLESHRQVSDFLEHPVGRVSTLVPGVLLSRGRDEEMVGEIAGPFILTKVLGSGGCGVVYLAEQERPVKRRVAVKIIHPDLQSKEMLARFDAERQALVLLNHANIAKLFDAGQTARGAPYFAMEFVDGPPLTVHCDRNNLGIEARLALFALVCGAVHHAHQKGIIHRDLKPSNVLVAATSEGDQPKVIDFGIAKSSTGPLTERTLVTQTGSPIGTLDYMSPEQMTGVAGSVDARSDVYSLGVILYELLAGVRPFALSQMSLLAAQRCITEREPAKPSDQVERAEKPPASGATTRELRGDLDWIILKAMEKDPDRRYGSVSELAADIERYRRKEPVEAGPPSRIYRLRKFIQRNRAATAASVVMILVLIAATVVSVASAVNARAAAHRNATFAYRNAILAASEAIDRDPSMARVSLDAAPKELRDWEWAYLNSRFHSAVTMFESKDALSSLATSADGKWIAVGAHDGSIHLWSQSDAAPRTLKGHSKRIHAMKFAPDGNALVSVSSDTTVRVWDVHTGQDRIVGTHSQGVATVAFGRTGRVVVSGGADGAVLVWDVAGETEGKRPLHRLQCKEGVYSVVYVGANDEEIIVGTNDGMLRHWDLKTDSLIREWRGSSVGIQALVSIPDTNEVISGSLDGTVTSWDVKSGNAISVFAGKGRAGVPSIATNLDSSLIAAADNDGNIAVWDRSTRERTAQLLSRTRLAQGVSFIGNSSTLVTAFWNGKVLLWQAGAGDSKRQIPLSSTRVSQVAFSTDGREVTAVDPSGATGRFAVESISAELKQTGEPSSAAASDETGGWIARGFKSGEVEVAATGASQPPSRFRSADPVTQVAVGRGGEIVACGSENGTVRAWRGDAAVPAQWNGAGGCTCLAISPDARFVAAGFRDNEAWIWNLLGDQSGRVWRGPKPVTCVAFSASGDLVAIGLQENSEATVHVLRVKDGREVVSFGGTGLEVRAVAFNPSGRRIATVGNNGMARIWNVADGHELLTIRDLGDDGNAIAFSPDGASLAVAGADGVLSIYEAKVRATPWGSFMLPGESK